MKKLKDKEFEEYWRKYSVIFADLASLSSTKSNIEMALSRIHGKLVDSDRRLMSVLHSKSGFSGGSPAYFQRGMYFTERNLKTSGAPTKSELMDRYVRPALKELSAVKSALSQLDKQAKNAGQSFYALWKEYENSIVRIQNIWNRINASVGKYDFN